MKIFKESLGLFVCNPVILCFYGMFCYELVLLCQYGRAGNTVGLLIGYFIFMVIIFVWELIESIRGVEFNGLEFLRSRVWLGISISLVVIISGVSGVKIYESGTNYGGKLAWFLDRMKNERTVEFVSDNMFEDGLDGIFDDINSKVQLPDVMYLVDEFTLRFDSNGEITSFDLFVHGKNVKNEDSSFLIYYNKQRDDLIRIHLNGYVSMDYHEDKLLAPLLETSNEIDFSDVVGEFLESEYGVYYEGKRSFPYGTDGVTVLLEEGDELPEISYDDLVGYAVSVFVPNKEDVIVPKRFMLRCYFGGEQPEIELTQSELDQLARESVFISEEVGYKLEVIDKALGSSFYGLNQTTNGGATWNMINQDPFGGAVSSIVGMTFINDEIGFMTAAKSSGTYSELYRTVDGGLTFSKIEIEDYEVELEEVGIIAPFDFPLIPEEKSGILSLLVGQGNDGDYLGNSQALYQSTDNGATWVFFEVVE